MLHVPVNCRHVSQSYRHAHPLQTTIKRLAEIHPLKHIVLLATISQNTCKIPSHLPPSSQPRQLNVKVPRKKMRCTCTGTGAMSEKQLGDGLITYEELVHLEKQGYKCKEVKGVAELLECLESEAIMGEDYGKDPGDYNLRAQIFDKSSGVFQALKHDNNISSPVVDLGLPSM